MNGLGICYIFMEDILYQLNMTTQHEWDSCLIGGAILGAWTSLAVASVTKVRMERYEIYNVVPLSRVTPP